MKQDPEPFAIMKTQRSIINIGLESSDGILPKHQASNIQTTQTCVHLKLKSRSKSLHYQKTFICRDHDSDELVCGIYKPFKKKEQLYAQLISPISDKSPSINWKRSLWIFKTTPTCKTFPIYTETVRWGLFHHFKHAETIRNLSK